MDRDGNPVIDVCISCGFGEDNRYALERIPKKIQLAVYKYDLFMKLKDEISKSVNKNNTNVKVVHLPLDTLRRKFTEISHIIEFCYNEFGCLKYVVHPNKHIEKFIFDFLFRWQSKGLKLCIETFQYRKKKKIRSPIDIMEWCIGYSALSMTLDTSHIESVWLNHMIIRSLLKYTSVIHLSNRAKGYGQHLPFNSPKGDLNLVSFVRDLKYKYKWEGDLVLEYMPEHNHRLIKNREYIKRLLA